MRDLVTISLVRKPIYFKGNSLKIHYLLDAAYDRMLIEKDF